jgi:hypothetical protein
MREREFFSATAQRTLRARPVFNSLSRVREKVGMRGDGAALS